MVEDNGAPLIEPAGKLRQSHHRSRAMQAPPNHLPAPLAELAEAERMMATSVRLSPAIVDQVDALAVRIGAGRGAVLRALVRAGLERVGPEAA
jgi:hypothetical protein